jgi:hypothetical protein
VNNIINKKFDFLKKYKNIKNFPENPNKGGIPAKDINTITIKTDTDWIPLAILNSFNVFIYLTSNKKNKKKILNSSVK